MESKKNKKKSNTYLTFNLNDETYALDVLKVREVLENSSTTKIPQTPPFMRGVINLRGSVVPVIDLKLKFGMEKTENQITTCIIVTEIKINNDEIVLGMIADSVQEVINLYLNDIEPPPAIGNRINNQFIEGMGKHDENFIIILNIDNIFNEDEINLVTKAGKTENSEILINA
jgi:purine-binding chemotaxis protein CheW